MSGLSDSYVEEIEAHRRAREASLLAEDGWLSQVDLVWLDDGPATLDIGTFTRDADGVSFVPAADSVGLAEETLRVDARDGPQWLVQGSRRYQLVCRGGSLGIRVRDADAPARRAFRQLSFYPVDPSWRVQGQLALEGLREVMRYTGGQQEDVLVPGCIRFCAPAGEALTLRPYAQENGSLLVVFRDASSGIETYPLCRYFVTEPPDAEGAVVLDFNRAAAPACAFVPAVTCVLPPPENTLPVAIRAGELWYRG